MSRPAELPYRHVDQIAVLVPDLKVAMDAYVATLGLKFAVFEANETNSTFSGAGEQFRIAIAVGFLGLLSIELIQPISGETFYSKQIASGGSGVHHFGVYVGDVAKAKKSFAKRGYQLILEGRITGLGKFAYFEAPAMCTVIELLQLPLSLPGFLVKNAKPYPAPG